MVIDCLLDQMETSRSQSSPFLGLVFVQKRCTVAALSHLLRHHPKTRNSFRTGYLVGSSSGGGDKDKKLGDLSKTLLPEPLSDTLERFKSGELDLLISTDVAKEGIDIQACGSVLRWDLPNDFVSLKQSCGRARMKGSIFTLMVASDERDKKVFQQWLELEEELSKMLNKEPEIPATEVDPESMDVEDDGTGIVLRIQSTGSVFFLSRPVILAPYSSMLRATLTLASAVQELNNFCAVLPKSAHVDNHPLYEFEPVLPPSTFTNVQPYSGLFGATVILPRTLPVARRIFGVDRTHSSKINAKRAAAFEAYKWLYEEGKMMDDHLQPLLHGLKPDNTFLATAIGKRAGTVLAPRQMNPWNPDNGCLSDGWWSSEVTIKGLPSFLLFTKRHLDAWETKDAPKLHYPDSSEPISVSLRPLGHLLQSSAPQILHAREYTSRVLWSLYSGRMSRDNDNYAYLFLPNHDSLYGNPEWQSFRSWSNEYNTSTAFIDPDMTLVNAAAFGEHFDYPESISTVKSSFKQGKVYRFVRWQYEPISNEETTRLEKRYRHIDGFQLTYPLLAVEPLPARENFLIPRREIVEALPRPLTYLAPRYTAMALMTAEETTLAQLLPSFLAFLGSYATISCMRETLWPKPSPLSEIPFNLVKTALTTTNTGAKDHYQRLEQLGVSGSRSLSLDYLPLGSIFPRIASSNTSCLASSSQCIKLGRRDT